MPEAVLEGSHDRLHRYQFFWQSDATWIRVYTIEIGAMRTCESKSVKNGNTAMLVSSYSFERKRSRRGSNSRNAATVFEPRVGEEFT